ncbi:MAG: GerMN domain-containing protein [Syntrophomonadaceae bacterium]|nr:GerMN domain-containing protein [Syntrophomonadaceae bacterium]
MRMRKGAIIFLGLAMLIVCLLSGGCSNTAADEELADWRQLFQEAPPADEEPLPITDDELLAQLGVLPESPAPGDAVGTGGEVMVVKLYYPDEMGYMSQEERTVAAEEGVARRTMELLLDGPEDAALQNIFPAGTTLKDINIKEDGECIVDLSAEVTGVKNREQEDLMVESIINTLGEYPTIKRVSFRVEGWDTNTLGGYTDLTGGVPIK